jgi:hypothetical protein
VAKIQVRAAIVAGVGLIRRRPLSMLAWGVLPVLLQVATLLAVAPIYLTLFGPALQAMGGYHPGVAPPPPPTQSFQLQGLVQLANLVELVVGAVISCAIWRSILHPERSSFASVRVGKPELLFAVLSFAGTIALTVGLIVLLIPTFILGGIVGGISHDVNIAMAVALPAFTLVALVVACYLLLRFSLVGPMMVADGRFHLFESWSRTRGHVGSLLLVGLGVFGLALLCQIVVLVVLFAIGGAAVFAVGGLGAVTTMIQHSPQALLGKLWPFLAGYSVLLIPIDGCLAAIIGAPWARVYQDLHPDTSDVFA